MNCHLCGKALGIAAAAAGDSDFCSTEHRTRFQARLSKAVALLRDDVCARPELAPPIIGFAPAERLSHPSARTEFTYPLRLPVASFAIAPDARPTMACIFQAEPVMQQNTEQNLLRHAEPMMPGGSGEAPFAVGIDRTAKLDKIAALGSRLRALRHELDRASNLARRFATA